MWDTNGVIYFSGCRNKADCSNVHFCLFLDNWLVLGACVNEKNTNNR